MSVGGSTSEARSERNLRLNRYSNVLPYDANRVRLQGGASDYINASLLASPPEEQPSWRYIATQVSLLRSLLHAAAAGSLRTSVGCHTCSLKPEWLVLECTHCSLLQSPTLLSIFWQHMRLQVLWLGGQCLAALTLTDTQVQSHSPT